MKEAILVTGGAKRVGRAIALKLSEQKPIVVHYNRSKKEALQLVEECKKRGFHAAAIHGDFSTHQKLLNFIERYQSHFPDTYGIVNNVGNYLRLPLTSTTEKMREVLFQTNLHAPYALISALLPSLILTKGRIVNIGTCGPHTQAPVYRETKRTLYDLTRSFAKELAPHFVTVNMVSPGFLEQSIDLPDVKTLPMRRAATFDEIAEMVAFLFCEKGAYITGQNIEVAGGIGL